MTAETSESGDDASAEVLALVARAGLPGFRTNQVDVPNASTAQAREDTSEASNDDGSAEVLAIINAAGLAGFTKPARSAASS